MKQLPTKLQTSALAAILTLIVPNVALAKDFCITINSSSYVLIGKTFFPPTRNNCKPWVGLVNQNNLNSPSAGTACTSADGSRINLTITTTYPEFNGIVFFDSITLDTASMTGNDNFTSALPTVGTATSYSAAAAFCPSTPIPSSTNSAMTLSPPQPGPGDPK